MIGITIRGTCPYTNEPCTSITRDSPKNTCYKVDGTKFEIGDIIKFILKGQYSSGTSGTITGFDKRTTICHYILYQDPEKTYPHKAHPYVVVLKYEGNDVEYYTRASL